MHIQPMGFKVRVHSGERAVHSVILYNVRLSGVNEQIHDLTSVSDM
jgi:hypothetical protein